MENIHTPERLPNESFSIYKLRRIVSALENKKITKKGIPNLMHFLTPEIKNTKHSRAGSNKRKGAL